MRTGHRVELVTLAGRPPAIGGPYCDEHGGAVRAQAEAEDDWNHIAPASVGDASAVRRAGLKHLDTRHAYVVIRPEHGRWLAWHGIGSHLEPITNPDAEPRRRAGRRQQKPSGSYAFTSPEAARLTAAKAWAALVARDVDAIRMARGGTLAWGAPVDPLPEPIVIELTEDGPGAWDVAVDLPRRSPPGTCAISGLRPSGEIA